MSPRWMYTDLQFMNTEAMRSHMEYQYCSDETLKYSTYVSTAAMRVRNVLVPM
jgi:hypothetical protein